MEDVHHGGHVAMRRVEVGFTEFVRRLHEEGVLLADMVRRLRGGGTPARSRE